MPTVLRGPLLKFINKSIHLFVRDRRLDWDFHIDDTPRDQWTGQGIPLLDSGSDEEKCWIRENRHSKRPAAIWSHPNCECTDTNRSTDCRIRSATHAAITRAVD